VAVAATLLAMVVYVFGLAHLQARGSRLVVPADLYIPRTIDVVIAVWCLWVGSSVGSFLNVVAWRMPRGQSINGRSYCPRCQAQLRARDNLPVFGWLALGGRCRTCRLPISVRYPLVEAAVGLTLSMVALAELYRLSLPRQAVHWHGGPFWAPLVDLSVLITLLYHAVGLSVCWAFGLIRMDNHRLPARLVMFGFAAATLPMLVFPALMIVPWQMQVGQLWAPGDRYADVPIRILSALTAATLMARYLARGLCPAADPKLDPLGRSTARLMDLIAILAIPTLLVGWQSSLAVVVLASLIAVALRCGLPAGCDSLGRFAIAMPLSLTFQIVCWRRLHATAADEGLTYWPSDGGSPWIILVWAGILALVPLWLRDEASGNQPGNPSVANEPPPAAANRPAGAAADRTAPSSDPAVRNRSHSHEENPPTS
jgi:leader peptidase (prepilin peptidase)/N-methyltransferase